MANLTLRSPMKDAPLMLTLLLLVVAITLEESCAFVPSAPISSSDSRSHYYPTANSQAFPRTTRALSMDLVALFGFRQRVKSACRSLRKRSRGQRKTEEADFAAVDSLVSNSQNEELTQSKLANGTLETSASPLRGVMSEPTRNLRSSTSTAAATAATNRKVASLSQNFAVATAAPLLNTEQPSGTTLESTPILSNSDSTSILQPDLPGLSETETLTLKRLYSLPPPDRDLTQLEEEFRGMIDYFSHFTQADLFTIRDPRLRTVFEGVIASHDVKPVYRAFEVLFEDLVPLRIAGRIIFAQLKQVMNKAQSRGQTEVDAIVATTGLKSREVEVSRLAFLTLAVATDNGHDEEAHLTLDQLVESGLAETAMKLLGYDSLENFLNNIDQDQSGKISFANLVVGLQEIAEDVCETSTEDICDPSVVLQAVVDQMEPALKEPYKVELDTQQQAFSDRFDKMVKDFQEWDDIVPTGEGRRLDVLRGCFVGAANQPVVNALRVVYIDYSVLRVAGNSIFALMKALVGQIRKRSSKDK